MGAPRVLMVGLIVFLFLPTSYAGAEEGENCTFAAGETRGRMDATKDTPVEWLIGGFCAGGACGCLGCLGTTGLAYFLDEDAPVSVCQSSQEYITGYQTGYQESRAREKAKWAFFGGTAGVAAGYVVVLLLLL